MSQKGFAPILIVILVAIAAAVVVGAYYFSFDHGFEKSVKVQTTQTPSSSPIDETANWKTYTNNEIGISFGYPNNWMLKEDEELCLLETGLIRVYQNQPCVHIGLSSLSDKSGFSNSFFSSESVMFLQNPPGRGGYWGDAGLKTNIQDFVKTYCDKFKTSQCSLNTNKQGVTFVKSLESEKVIQSNRSALYYYVQNKNKDFPVISLSNQAYLDNLTLIDSEKIFDQILSTFKFLP